MLEARAVRVEEIKNDPNSRMRPGMMFHEDAEHDLLTGKVLDQHQSLALRSLDIIGESFTTEALDRTEDIVRSDRFAAREIVRTRRPSTARRSGRSRRSVRRTPPS